MLCCPQWGRLIGYAFRDRIPSSGVWIDTDSPLVSPEIKASLFWGFYESAEVRFVRRYLPRDLDVVELGASIGVVSSQIARRLDSHRRMICVEAHEALLPIIARNIRRNAPHIRADVQHGAVAYLDQATIPFRVALRNVDSRIVEHPSASDAPVPVVRLHQLVGAAGILDYALVCDIEGCEAGLLFEDAEALARCRFLIAELHEVEFRGERVTVRKMLERLEALGFTLVEQRGPVVAAVKHCPGGTR
jgi:FkbM family methyltransferase